MKYFLLFASLVAAVSCKEDWTRAGIAGRFPLQALFASTMGVNADRHIKHTPYSSNDESDKDLMLFNFLMDMEVDMITKCLDSSVPDAHHIFEEAKGNYKKCINHIHLQKVSNGGSDVEDACSTLVEVNKCFVQFSEELQPCLPRYNGEDFPYSSIVQAFFNYTCGDEEAKERLKDFFKDVYVCLNGLAPFTGESPCGKYPKLGETSYTYSEADCKIAYDLWNCVETKIPDECTPERLNYIKGMGHAISQFYEPCPSTPKAEKAHLPSWMRF